MNWVCATVRDFLLLRNLKLWNKKLELTQKITSVFYLVSFVDEAFVLIFKLRFILGTQYVNGGMALISEHTESCSEDLRCRDFLGGPLIYLCITNCLWELSLVSLCGCLRMWSLFLLNLFFFQCMFTPWQLRHWLWGHCFRSCRRS